MGRWLITLTAVAALVVVPAALPGDASTRNVARSFTIAGGATKSVTVRCPRGWVAASGGVRSAGEGTTTLAIRPAGASAVNVRVANPRGNASHRMAVAATCLGLRGGRSAPHYKAAHVRRRISVAAGSQKQAGLRCPSGMLTAGAGFDVFGLPLQVRREGLALNSFSFTVQNDGTRARSALLYGTCLTLVRPAGARRVRLNVRVLTVTTPLAPGTRTVGEACPRGWFGLATGYTLPASVTLGGSVALPGGGRWSLTNDTTKPVLPDLQLACARIA